MPDLPVEKEKDVGALKPQTRPFKIPEAPVDPEPEAPVDPEPEAPVDPEPPKMQPMARPFKPETRPLQPEARITQPVKTATIPFKPEISPHHLKPAVLPAPRPQEVLDDEPESAVDPEPASQIPTQKELRTISPRNFGSAPSTASEPPKREPRRVSPSITPQEQVVGSDGAVTPPSDKKCFNWFGMNLVAEKIPTANYGEPLGQPWGEMKSNVCNSGLTKPYGAYSCWARSTSGLLKPCGHNVNCVAGVCVKEQNLQHSWSKDVANRQCNGNLLDELSGDANDHTVLDCKILCESIDTCTGFNEGEEKCSLFSSFSTEANCEQNPEYKVHFVTRAS